MKLMTCSVCGHKFSVRGLVSKQKWKESKKACPVCKEIYSSFPPTERKLHILQDLYYETQDQNYLNEMSKILISYTSSIIKKYFMSTEYIKDSQDIQYYTENTVSIFIDENYIKRKIYVYASFYGMIRPRISQAIYGKKEHLLSKSTLNYSFEDDHQALYPDKRNIIDEIDYNFNKKDLCKLIDASLDDLNHGTTNRINFIRLINMSNFIQKGEKVCDMFFAPVENGGFGRDGKEEFDNSLRSFRQNILDFITI